MTAVFDGRAGFNVVRWARTREGKTYDELRAAYRSVSGIFIPESFDVTIHKQSAGEWIPHTMRSAVLQDTELNGKILAEEFGTDQFNWRTV